MQRVNHQKAKIVATVGPASSSYDMLLGLVQAGVDVFRLNFSHGAHDELEKVINHIMYINEKYNLHISILADLQGPKLRIGKMAKGAVELERGDIINFTNEECLGTNKKVYMNYAQFASDVKVGERVLVDDGKLVFEVLETNGTDLVKMEVKFGGQLSSNKGVNLPNTKISLPSLTEKDLKDLDFILKQPINWIALSFVRSPSDIKELRKIVDAAKHPAKILAKIEKPEAIDNIDKIIKASNGIMVARGDLGIEVPIEKLPTMQKMIVRKCLKYSRPCIVATHMMDSMITSPIPTRAEILDVANAVLDGADAVMLSGETSVGEHPILVVEEMNKIIYEAEYHHPDKITASKPSKKARTFFSDSICYNAAKLAGDIGAKAIIGMTSSGYTAFKVSSFRPDDKIYIFSDQHHMLSTLGLVWGVECFYYDKFTTTDETITDVTDILKNKGLLRTGDVVVNSGSMPLAKRYRTNMLKITVIE
ncbi:MAG: pyruvate kinase [Bacteroidia bacterium]|nr:pyruvate kinase [Bacteroidia bacterium]